MVASQKIVGCFAVTHDVNWALIPIGMRMHACGAGLIITVHYRVVRTKTVIQSSSVGWAASFRVGSSAPIFLFESVGHTTKRPEDTLPTCVRWADCLTLKNASFEQAGRFSSLIGTPFLSSTNLGLDCNKTIRRTPKDSNFGCSPGSVSQMSNSN